MKAHDYQPNPFAPGWERCTGCGLVASPGTPADSRGGDCHEVQIAQLTEDRARLLERLRSCTCEGPQGEERRAGGKADPCARCGLARGFHGPVLAAAGDPQCDGFVARPQGEESGT